MQIQKLCRRPHAHSCTCKAGATGIQPCASCLYETSVRSREALLPKLAGSQYIQAGRCNFKLALVGHEPSHEPRRVRFFEGREGVHKLFYSLLSGMNNGQGEGFGRWLSPVPLQSPQREESGLRTPTSACAQGTLCEGRDAPLCEGREGGFSPGLSTENREGAPSVALSPCARSDAEETLLKWQEELGDDLGAIQGLESNACAALLSQKKEVLGLHRVSRAERGKDSDSEEIESNTPTCQEDFGPRTTGTSTTISKVVDYIGKRMQEVHAEMITLRSMHAPDSDGVNDPDHVPQIVFPPAAQRQDREELKMEGRGGEGAGCSPQPGSLTARSGSPTARHQIVPKTALPFLFARVDSFKSEQPQLQDSEIENVDQNAVVEWLVQIYYCHEQRHNSSFKVFLM